MRVYMVLDRLVIQDGGKKERGWVQRRDVKSLRKWKQAADRLMVDSDRFTGSRRTRSFLSGKAYSTARFISRSAPVPNARAYPQTGQPHICSTYCSIHIIILVPSIIKQFHKMQFICTWIIQKFSKQTSIGGRRLPQ
jgi:hypothetical protein